MTLNELMFKVALSKEAFKYYSKVDIKTAARLDIDRMKKVVNIIGILPRGQAYK